MRNVVVLGATGSIGRQTLDVVRRLPDRLRIVGLTANSSSGPLRQLAKEFGVENLALMSAKAGNESGIPGGMEAVVDVATQAEADTIVVAVAGVIGLVPTLAAIRAGKQIALASKEVLVAAGELVMPLIRKSNKPLTPIDSEHSAIFQCVQGAPVDAIDSIILTASGGPFRGKTRDDLKSVTREQALNHPTWKMGGKITVDSATLMNKALEMIEARWLFDLPMSKVDAVIHPQSIIHSLVRFRDGSVLGQMGWPDMRLPIQYALLYPERVDSGLKTWNPIDTPDLSFEKPDPHTFRALHLAREAMKRGGTLPCVFNAANEACANGFLEGKCGFLAIADTVEQVMRRHGPSEVTLDSLLDADQWARRVAHELMAKGPQA
ncbi:MAG: 1-deoxy-D-xylulose-5-phosphate reductoisomerase [Fimbriimonadaceae bacterium]|nr:1-deoxy-D-xylulose-5-phosphate reductoisomerase [Fimbriimonadaceae bacterium]